MNAAFLNSVQMERVARNMFDLSFDHKFSCNMGELIPVSWINCMPGDKFRCAQQSLVRFAPLTAPVMHQLYTTFHTFFVPYRILWPAFEDFIVNPQTNIAHPSIVIEGDEYPRLADYLGMPPALVNDLNINALIFSAYQKIWNDYYRDENLQTEDWVPLTNGSNAAQFTMLTKLRRRAWAPDYFTKSLPFAQKGNPVDIPVGALGDAPVYVNATVDPNYTELTGVPNDVVVQSAAGQGVPAGQLFAAIAEAPYLAVTINDLRTAKNLQEFLERLARGGSRYFEVMQSMFGIKSPDSRLQRPEYVNGVKKPIVISEVLNTGDATLPQGNMAGHGVTFLEGDYGNYSCQEHGVLMTIMCTQPKPAYQQGVSRHFLALDQMDYPWPQFAHLGEQMVYKAEIYADAAEPYGEWGYMPQYAHFKVSHDRVSGDFRNVLKYWHFSRIFETEPQLNDEFVECNPRTDPFAVEDEGEEKLYVDVYNDIKVLRALPKFGTPTF